MTFVSLLLAAYPIPFQNEYLVHLTFVPLCFRTLYQHDIYTHGCFYRIFSRCIYLWKLNYLWYYINRYCRYVSAVGPFLKQNDIISLFILNLISIIILLFLALLSPIYELVEILVLIPISFIITIASAITFVDIWHFFSFSQSL